MAITSFSEWLQLSGPRSIDELVQLLDAIEIGGKHGPYQATLAIGGRVFVQRKKGLTLALLSTRAKRAFAHLLQSKYLGARRDQDEDEDE